VTPTEAQALARTLAGSWPRRGVDEATWAPILEALDYGPALDTVVRLVDTTEHPPSVTAYRAAYRATLAPGLRYLREDCARCDGTGFEFIEIHREGHPFPTSGVVPCRCSEGKRHDDAHRAAIEHNEHELRRTRPVGAPGSPRIDANRVPA
jgi:hypothetical protein